MTIIDKIKVGDIVLYNFIQYRITGKITDTKYSWEQVYNPSATGLFEFTEDQQEDFGFLIIG